MKIKTTFEVKDFEVSGQLIIRESSPRGSKDYLFALSVSYKIGYSFEKEIGKKICMISLSDGMVALFDDVTALCGHLNSDICGYRPMSKLEIENILTLEGNRFPIS